MRLGRITVQRIRSLFRRSRIEHDLQQEIELHMAQLVKQYRDSGMSEAEARIAAGREFGPVELTKEQCRDTRRVNLLEDLAKDLVYTFRQLKMSPGFALTAVLSLALGIGANTIVFSVLNALLLQPLPVAQPDRIFFVDNSGHPTNTFPNYRDIQDCNGVFESLFAYPISPFAVGDSTGTQRVWGFMVTGNYFESLGLQPAVGRFFTPQEDVRPSANPYAVLSYECWQNRFAADRKIAGRQIRVNNHLYTVLGVAPRGFYGTERLIRSEMWIPMSMQPQIEGQSNLDSRFSFNYCITGRLKPGVTVARAEANLKAIAQQLAKQYPVNEGMRLTLSKPGLAGSLLREPTRAFAAGVMLLAILVLLAACANLAALLTSRAVGRERDLAIRVSVGAGRGRLVRQLLTESFTIAVMGGVAGCLVALALLGMLTQWRAPLDFPVQFDATPDWRVFLFTLCAALTTGFLFGAGPAWRASKADPALSLKGLAAPIIGRRWAVRDLLLPLQISLCCALVIASLVAVRGLARSLVTPLGIVPEGVTVISCDLGAAGYDTVHGRLLEQRAIENIARLPGVESAAYSNSVPLSLDQSNNAVYRQTTTDFRPRNSFQATFYEVSPGYFKTMGTRVLTGRDFTQLDDSNAPPVAVVNQTFALRVIGTADAIGRRFRCRGRLLEIVGVVEDGKYTTLTETPRMAMFVPLEQQYESSILLLARSARPAPELAAEMRRVITGIDPQVSVYGEGSLRVMLRMVYLPMHAAVIALGAFGALALMLSITGIYGLAAYTVSRREKEIGIRMAIGATPWQVLRLVFTRIATLISAGALAGLALGIAGASVLASIVYQASSRDPVVIGGAVISISLVALAAAYGPARRALRADPAQSLRHE